MADCGSDVNVDVVPARERDKKEVISREIVPRYFALRPAQIQKKEEEERRSNTPWLDVLMRATNGGAASLHLHG